MKKIRLITFHTPKNYGAVLQAFSLISFVRQYTDDAVVIDYNTVHLRSLYRIIGKVNSLKSFLMNIYLIPTYSKKKCKYRKFDQFVYDFIPLTKERFESVHELKQFFQDSDVDLYITGSDQVFNPNRIEDERKSFYMDFVPLGKPKISYAASFGCKDISRNKINDIGKSLSGFKDISVRELSGKKLLKDLYNIDSEVVLDPVFLNERAFWEKVALTYKKCRHSNYLLFYRLMNNKGVEEKVKKFAKQKGLDLIVIADGVCNIAGARVLRDVGPRELLGLYKEASFIATDAFHGVAFALIFHKQFVFVDTNNKTNNRGAELMKMLNITCCENWSEQAEVVDYKEVDKILELKIEYSKRFLLKYLK